MGSRWPTFDESKTLMLSNIEALQELAATYESYFPGIGFANDHANLRLLEQKMLQMKSPELSISDVEQLEILANHITTGSFPKVYFKSKTIPSRLPIFWDISKKFMEEYWTKKNRNLDVTDKALKTLPRVNAANDITNYIMKEIPADPNSAMCITSYMLVHIIRTEAHEKAVHESLKNAIKEMNLQGHDVADLCSIDSRVPRNTTYESDVRAIRNAIGHGQFSISKNDGLLEIDFHNNEDGYNFNKLMTGYEFLEMIVDHGRLLHT
jgi:hypothetical protein